jgi:hypothetical protein
MAPHASTMAMAASAIPAPVAVKGPGMAVRDPGQVKKRGYRLGRALQAYRGGDSAALP